MKSRISLLPLGALILSSPAQAATQVPCLSPAEAHSLVTYTLPDIITGLINHCRPHIPATAWLVTGAPSVVPTYRAAANGSWPTARKAAEKLSTAAFMVRLLPDSVVQATMRAMISKGVADSVKPADCGFVDRAMEQVAPLPAQNMTNLITLMIEIDNAKAKNRKPAITICPTVPKVSNVK